MLIGISDACLHCQHLFIGLLFYEREGNPEYLAETANGSGRIRSTIMVSLDTGLSNMSQCNLREQHPRNKSTVNKSKLKLLFSDSATVIVLLDFPIAQ